MKDESLTPRPLSRREGRFKNLNIRSGFGSLTLLGEVGRGLLITYKLFAKQLLKFKVQPLTS